MYDQGYALRKILASPLGTQPCRLGCPEVKLCHPDEKIIIITKKNNWLINYNYLITSLINIWQPIDTQIKMSCIVSRAFILFTDAKDKRLTCNFFVILMSKVHKERQNLHIFWVAMVDILYVEKKSFYPLSPPCFW